MIKPDKTNREKLARHIEWLEDQAYEEYCESENADAVYALENARPPEYDPESLAEMDAQDHYA